MYNIPDCYYKEAIIQCIQILHREGIEVDKVKHFCDNEVTKLTEHDLILSLEDIPTIFKPTSIYPKNNYYLLEHVLVANINNAGIYIKNNNMFQGYMEIGKYPWETTVEQYQSLFVLKCKKNMYSKKLERGIPL